MADKLKGRLFFIPEGSGRCGTDARNVTGHLIDEFGHDQGEIYETEFTGNVTDGCAEYTVWVKRD